MTEHIIYEAAAHQVAHAEQRLDAVRVGLRELKADAAAQSLHDGHNSGTRAAFARFEGAIEHLLDIAGLGVLALILALALGGSAAQAAPDPVPGAGLYFINLAPSLDGNTYFRYELRGGGAPAISHVVLNICTSRLSNVIVETPESVSLEITPDVLKIETSSMGDYETKIITLIMRGSRWSALPTAYTIKAGQQILSGETYGPHCTSNAVHLTGFSARFDLGAWLRALLG